MFSSCDGYRNNEQGDRAEGRSTAGKTVSQALSA